MNALSPSLRFAAALVTLVQLAGCGQDAGPAIPPPFAGLQHAEVVRVGQAVQFDGQPSRAGALRDVDGVVVEQAAIVRFTFAAADGSPAQDVTGPVWQHVFTAPGIFAVSLTIEDAKGRTSTVQSTLHVTADYTATCTESAADLCDSGRCIGDVCSRVACADQVVCPEGTTCASGFCYVSPPTSAGADALSGADAGAVGADAHD
ncbi:MAG: PKD domain-containing protein [Myxococcales bacterium]|nr:PKD domain-containing protein [Myxococcales bacterium]